VLGVVVLGLYVLVAWAIAKKERWQDLERLIHRRRRSR
jgi:hypothetical protein